MSRKNTIRPASTSRRFPRKGEGIAESYFRNVSGDVSDSIGPTARARVVRGQGQSAGSIGPGIQGVALVCLVVEELADLLRCTSTTDGSEVWIAKPYKLRGAVLSRVKNSEDQEILPRYLLGDEVQADPVMGQLFSQTPIMGETIVPALVNPVVRLEIPMLETGEGNIIQFVDKNSDGRFWAEVT